MCLSDEQETLANAYILERIVHVFVSKLTRFCRLPAVLVIIESATRRRDPSCLSRLHTVHTTGAHALSRLNENQRTPKLFYGMHDFIHPKLSNALCLRLLWHVRDFRTFPSLGPEFPGEACVSCRKEEATDADDRTALRCFVSTAFQGAQQSTPSTAV